MKQILNTLYVMTQGSYVHLDNETVRIEVEGETRLRVPLHHLGSVVVMGNVLISPYLLAKCARDGRSVTLLDRNGRFSCRMEGPASGNILLRHAQNDAFRDAARSDEIARSIVAGKLRNSRVLLRRAARENGNVAESEQLGAAADHLDGLLARLRNATGINVMRGIEGEGAKVYFGVFSLMLKPAVRKEFIFTERNRRPPRDCINALLSFLYTLLTHDAVSAAEGVGLDPREGFLHVIRPGRPALGLDLVEEFRAQVADRLALTLMNRKQLSHTDFDERPGGAVLLNEAGRKTVLQAYQKRKQEEIVHQLFREKVPIGMLPHIQARLLARHLRGDSEHYLPMLFR
jgi:CRISPR-associated protein Cas1